MIDWQTIALLIAAGLGAGFVNSLAGGGTMIAYPALLAVGLSPIGANVTALFGLFSGYLGAAHAYRSELRVQRARAMWLSIPAVVGGVSGAALLLITPPGLFERIIPFLVLAATILLGVQGWLPRPGHPGRGTARSQIAIVVLIFLAGVYGAYFSAGLGVLLLAFLGLRIRANLQHLNALKSILSLVIVVAAMLLYLPSGHVSWPHVAVLLPATALGGYFGARLARRLPPLPLRIATCVLGLAIATWLLLDTYVLTT